MRTGGSQNNVTCRREYNILSCLSINTFRMFHIRRDSCCRQRNPRHTYRRSPRQAQCPAVPSRRQCPCPSTQTTTDVTSLHTCTFVFLSYRIYYTSQPFHRKQFTFGFCEGSIMMFSVISPLFFTCKNQDRKSGYL